MKARNLSARNLVRGEVPRKTRIISHHGSTGVQMLDHHRITTSRPFGVEKKFKGHRFVKLIRPQSFDPKRSAALGFRAEKSFDEIIPVHIEDELDNAILA